MYHHVLQKQKRETPFSGYILLSGGDDVGLWYEDIGEELFHEILSNAKKALAEDRGEERPTLRRCFLEDFSYQSAYDILNPDGLYNCFPFYETFQKRLGTKILFQEFVSLDIPTCVLFSDSDEYIRFPIEDVVDTLRSHNPNAEYEIMHGANHGFEGFELQLANTITQWIGKR